MTLRSTISKLSAIAMLSLLAACGDSVTQPASLAAPSEASLAKGVSGANAKLCHKGGYLTLARADGTTFADQKDCMSYAKGGGEFWPPAVIDAVGVVNDGVSFNFNVTAMHLMPGSTLHILATGIDYSFGPLVDGSIGVGTATICGQGYTDWYATGTTITGATIESAHFTGCP